MENYQNCIEAAQRCANVCLHCLVSCMREEKSGSLKECMRLDLECEAICRATARLLVSGSGVALKLCILCAELCEACAAECEKHADMEHCAACAEACRACAQECRMLK